MNEEFPQAAMDAILISMIVITLPIAWPVWLLAGAIYLYRKGKR